MAISPGSWDRDTRGRIGNEAITQEAQRKAQGSNRCGFRNAFRNFFLRKSSIRTDGAIIHKRTAGDDVGSVSDCYVGSAESSFGLRWPTRNSVTCEAAPETGL